MISSPIFAIGIATAANRAGPFRSQSRNRIARVRAEVERQLSKVFVLSNEALDFLTRRPDNSYFGSRQRLGQMIQLIEEARTTWENLSARDTELLAGRRQFERIDTGAINGMIEEHDATWEARARIAISSMQAEIVALKIIVSGGRGSH